MKTKKALLILVCIILTGGIHAQEVVAPAGNFFQGNGKSISWTLGELAIETFYGDDIIITQGFQQPQLTIPSSIDHLDNEFDILAYPNPASEFIQITFQNGIPENAAYVLYGFKGEQIRSGKIVHASEKISLENVEPGIYFIQIKHQSILLKTVKVIKH